MDTTSLLIDSGGQYMRRNRGCDAELALWHTTAEYVDSYTRVLKRHIGLDVMSSGKHTPVCFGYLRPSLVVGCRQGLRPRNRCHGVGAALNVTGPEDQSSVDQQRVNKQGMVISNEPGYYEDGKYGIRIENRWRSST
jgi:Xaa-Pro aminopeptidase